MGRRARSTVISSEPVGEFVPVVVYPAPEPKPEPAPPEAPLIPAAIRYLKLFRKINTKGYFTDMEYNRICLIVAGDRRRILQRLLIGLYQRAQQHHDGAEASRARLLMSLHDAGRLEENLELVE
jgi:hypothetical protein